ncbi:MAG: outer membrane beta-barrel protein [Cryomorphaceae bacterium]
MKKMLRNAVVAALIGFSATSVLAQESDMDDRKFRFGLHASPNLGWVRPNIPEFDKSGLQARLGFGYGLIMDFKFSESPNYLFSTGVNLTTNGGGLIEPWDSLDVVQVNDSTTSANYFFGKLDRTYRYQYVNIPILLKMRTNEVGYMTYFAAVGFDVGVRTRAFVNDDYTWEQSGLTPPDQKDINFQKNTQLFRLGINITGGGEFNLSGKTNLYVGIGYHNHFTNMFRKTPENRILEPGSDGTPDLVDGMAVVGKQKKAATDYVSLNIGVFF